MRFTGTDGGAGPNCPLTLGNPDHATLRRMRARWVPAVAIAGLLVAGGAQADAPAEGARLARIAHETGDAAALARVAGSAYGDVWLVVERLLEVPAAADAAGALANAAAGVAGADRLAAYATWRTANALPAGTHDRLVRVEAFLSRRASAQARATLEEGALPHDGVAGVRYWWIQSRLQRDPAQAMEAALRAIKEAEAIGWAAGHRQALVLGLRLARATKDPVRAGELGERLLDLLGKAGDRALRRFGHDALARAARAQRQRAVSVRHARAAYDLAEGTLQERNALRYLMIVEADSPAQRRVRDSLLVLRGLEVELGDAHGTAATDLRLAAVEARLGRWASAVERLERALAFFEEKGRPYERRGAHLNAAIVAVEMFDGKRAQRHVAAARAAGEGLGLDDTVLYELEATAHVLQKNRKAAARAYRTVLARRKHANPRARGGTWMSLATTLAKDGRLDEARAALASAREALEGVTEHNALARLHAAESVVHLVAGDVDASVRAAESARRVADELLLDMLSSGIETRLAEGLLSQGHAGRALVHAERAVALVLRRSAALPESIGAQHRAALTLLFQLVIEAALRTGDMERFFAGAERARAVALRSRIGGPEAALDVLAPELLARELQLRDAETDLVRRFRVASTLR